MSKEQKKDESLFKADLLTYDVAVSLSLIGRDSVTFHIAKTTHPPLINKFLIITITEEGEKGEDIGIVRREHHHFV